MKASKSERRERKQFNARHGMRVTGRSVFVVRDVIITKGKKAKKAKKAKKGKRK